MKEIDVKHLAYHVLVALYFIWLAIFSVLVVFALNSTLSAVNPDLTKILLLWLLLNIVIGSTLFFVIRLFNSNRVIYRIILYTYFTMVIACVCTMILASNFLE